MTIGIIDIETTGFFKWGGRIVEVGMVSLDLETGEVKEVLDFICREGGMTDRDYGAWIFQNSNLSPNDVMEAQLFHERISEIQEAIDTQDYVTAYNKKFDFEFLRDRGIKIEREWPCPMIVATPVCKLPGKWGKYKWPKVEEAWRHFFPDVPYVEAHRGADDARHEALIVYELYKRGFIEEKR